MKGDLKPETTTTSITTVKKTSNSELQILHLYNDMQTVRQLSMPIKQHNYQVNIPWSQQNAERMVSSQSQLISKTSLSVIDQGLKTNSEFFQFNH